MRQYKLLKTYAISRYFARNNSSQSRFKFKEHNKKSIRPRDFIHLTIPITTFGLGCWQVQRGEWKNNLLKELKFKTSQEPIEEIPSSYEELKDVEYRPVRVRGEFLHENIVYIGPKTKIHNGNVDLFPPPQENGYHVITPFKLENSEKRILVNRGWVPNNKLTPTSRKESVPTGVIELIGLFRISEIKDWRKLQQNQEHTNNWMIRDVEALAVKLNTLPVFIDATKSSDIKNGPIGGQTRIKLPNDHFTYQITWFTLSACTTLLWLSKFILKR